MTAKRRNESFLQIGALGVEIAIGDRSRPLGRLAWHKDERRAYFEFDRGFLGAPLPISPFRLPAKAGVTSARAQTFEGLHGLFNDSLPDG
ncbi:HipA N-terminal domain-containing protein [Methylobacterium radiodurans]|uniref:HipA N-terminal domain-containing protein n=1 Tax=Methylobacterium radiodurans TaxID=2202828 RepID=UPI001FEAC562|nr:HipA N-terminal domain-containing protein [Methylobacterium radiodurans]